MSVIPWPGTAALTDCAPHDTAPPPATVSATLARVLGISPMLAAEMLVRYGSLGALRRVDTATLRASHGLTARQATRLQAALELATSLLVEPRLARPQITQPGDAARLVLPEMGLLESEQMRLLLLDTKNRLIVALTLYAGTINACHVRVAEVFREAVRRNASALILLHNHPSGALDPSPEDIALTREVVQAGRLLDVDVLDHVIVAGSAYLSLRERGHGWQ